MTIMQNANQNREISFQEFESRYKGQLSSKEDPHGHHKKFMELDKDGNLRVRFKCKNEDSSMILQ